MHLSRLQEEQDLLSVTANRALDELNVSKTTVNIYDKAKTRNRHKC